MSSPFSSTDDRGPWLIRADFTDQRRWEEIGAAAAVDRWRDDRPTVAEVFRVVDDLRYDGLTPAGLLALAPYPHAVYLLVDHVTITHPEHPLLAVDAWEEPGISFRLVPDTVASFVANRSIANMDFSDFAEDLHPDGIHRHRSSFDVPEPPAPEPAPDVPPPPPPVEPDPAAAPGDALDWALSLRSTDFDRGRELLQAVIDTGHPEHAAWAAFHLGEWLMYVDPASSCAALEVAMAYEPENASSGAAVLLGAVRLGLRDFDGAERALLTAIGSGEPGAARTATLKLTALRAQGRVSLEAHGYQPPDYGPWVTTVVARLDPGR